MSSTQPRTTRDSAADAAHLWRAPELGERHTLDLSAGTLEYFTRGSGPPMVFAHGWLANANLWRHVVDALAGRFRCLTLDLPLGSHRVPMRPDADLSPHGCGTLIADALDALAVVDATLVGNDSGGAYSQIATAQRPQRIGRLVLNCCETLYDEFPPEPFTGLPAAAESAETLRQLLIPLADRSIRPTPPAYGLVAKRPIDDTVSDTYVLPCLQNPDVLRDTSKVMRTASSAPLHQAAERLIASFTRPVLFAWASEDRIFPVAHAERYAAQLRDARVALIDDAYSFTPEDQPKELARVIADFAGAGRG